VKPASSAAPRRSELDLEAPYELHPDVAIRPEPFGALVYHYGNRRLNFLRSPVLVDVVSTLADHRSVTATFDAAAVPEQRRAAYSAALAALADSDVIRAR
jgi:putative mycofactocin binding protein MftB